MTRRAVILFAAFSLMALPVLPVAPATAATRAAPSRAMTAAVPTHPVLAARFGFGRGFGARTGYRPRARTPFTRSPRTYRRATRPYRPRIGHFFGNVLKALGIAYLFHMLFGWGAGGGSPFGLLIVLAFVAWLLTRRRRRPLRYY
jgi:hypothetical protein